MSYKEKPCLNCSKMFFPTSGKQKYCIDCIPLMKRERDRERERIMDHLDKEIIVKFCLCCGIRFKTYYPQKNNCGAKYCESERIKIKNRNFQLKHYK